VSENENFVVSIEKLRSENENLTVDNNKLQIDLGAGQNLFDNLDSLRNVLMVH